MSWPGFRVVHYSIQDNHAHFIVEAAGRERLANGIKSLAARFARCVKRVFGRSGKVLADRFHHVVERTPTEVRRALAYVLLNIRTSASYRKCHNLLNILCKWTTRQALYPPRVRWGRRLAAQNEDRGLTGDRRL